MPLSKPKPGKLGHYPPRCLIDALERLSYPESLAQSCVCAPAGITPCRAFRRQVTWKPGL
jgi:hypothetical protein